MVSENRFSGKTYFIQLVPWHALALVLDHGATLVELHSRAPRGVHLLAHLLLDVAAVLEWHLQNTVF